jgi:hypothetical protein
VLEDGFGKQRREDYNQRQQFGRWCQHREDLSWSRFLPQLTPSALTFSKTKNG